MGSLEARSTNEKLLISSSREENNNGADETSSGFMKVTREALNKCLDDLKDFTRKAWEMGRSDPRKVIFAAKMGLALSAISLLIFWKGLNQDVAQYSIWAILTVIVMFEFTIGATLIKGFNRGLGTLCAGILAFGFAELSVLAGQLEEVAIVISIFIAGFCGSYLKLYPTMKPYEYGFRVFILTYCILMVAGNRTREYSEAVVTRLVLIGLGASVCFVVNICIYPIWAGEALHDLVVKNFKDVSNSLQGCVNGYLKCDSYERIPSMILPYQASDEPLYNGYRWVVESTGKEETLLGFAIWEPPHGRYRISNYPWKNFVKLSDALKHCAFTVMALHGCILSEIQAPAGKRRVFAGELQKVGTEGAKVLSELGNKLEKMEKLNPAGDILKSVHEAAEKLQKKIDQKSYLLVNSESWEIGRRPKLEEPEKFAGTNNNENIELGVKSLSETVLDLRSIPGAIEASWPLQLSRLIDESEEEDESKTYESASGLSLATFASLLIEFVARLQSVVDLFEELSEKADFAEPDFDKQVTRSRFDGLWAGLSKFFSLKT